MKLKLLHTLRWQDEIHDLVKKSSNHLGYYVMTIIAWIFFSLGHNNMSSWDVKYWNGRVFVAMIIHHVMWFFFFTSISIYRMQSFQLNQWENNLFSNAFLSLLFSWSIYCWCYISGQIGDIKCMRTTNMEFVPVQTPLPGFVVHSSRSSFLHRSLSLCLVFADLLASGYAVSNHFLRDPFS